MTLLVHGYNNKGASDFFKRIGQTSRWSIGPTVWTKAEKITARISIVTSYSFIEFLLHVVYGFFSVTPFCGRNKSEWPHGSPMISSFFFFSFSQERTMSTMSVSTF
jgi:hypothetical protein